MTFHDIIANNTNILEFLRQDGIESVVRHIANSVGYVDNDIWDKLLPLWTLFLQVNAKDIVKCMEKRFSAKIDVRSLIHLFKNDESARRRKMAWMMCKLIVESDIFSHTASIESGPPSNDSELSNPSSIALAAVPACGNLSVSVPEFVPRFVAPYSSQSQNSLPACTAIREILLNANADDLRSIVLQLTLNGMFSRSNFCKQNHLQLGDFRKWLTNTELNVEMGENKYALRSDNAGVHTGLVREFLLSIIPIEPINEKYSKIIAVEKPKRLSEALTNPILIADRDFANLCKNIAYSHPEFKSKVSAMNSENSAKFSEMLVGKKQRDQTFLQRIIDSRPQYVIFVDADNMLTPTMTSLLRLLSYYPNLQIFVYLIMAPATAINNLWKLDYYNSEWIHVMIAPITSKDAADGLLCMQAMYVHMAVDRSIKFVVCSDDTFGISAVESMRYFGRNCTYVDTGDSVGLVLLREIPPHGDLEHLINLLLQISPADGYCNVLRKHLLRQLDSFAYMGEKCERYIFQEMKHHMRKKDKGLF